MDARSAPRFPIPRETNSALIKGDWKVALRCIYHTCFTFPRSGCVKRAGYRRCGSNERQPQILPLRVRMTTLEEFEAGGLSPMKKFGSENMQAGRPFSSRICFRQPKLSSYPFFFRSLSGRLDLVHSRILTTAAPDVFPTAPDTFG
jgi:hypothetical protein